MINELIVFLFLVAFYATMWPRYRRPPRREPPEAQPAPPPAPPWYHREGA